MGLEMEDIHDNIEYDKHLMKIDIVNADSMHSFREKLQERVRDLQLAGFMVYEPKFIVDNGKFYGFICYDLDVADDDNEEIEEEDIMDDF